MARPVSKTVRSFVGLTHTTPSVHGLHVQWPARVIRQAQDEAARLHSSASAVWSAIVIGHTTPNLADIGGSSVRLRFDCRSTEGCLQDGGYVFGLRPLPLHRVHNAAFRWLPALAGVPGERGPDDHGNFRQGLAECLVLGRPIEGRPSAATFLHDAPLQEAYPTGLLVEVVVLARVTDFFLGLNAGQWLKIRILQIANAGEQLLGKRYGVGPCREEAATLESVLEGSGFAPCHRAEPPPEDASYLHHYYGNFAVSSKAQGR